MNQEPETEYIVTTEAGENPLQTDHHVSIERNLMKDLCGQGDDKEQDKSPMLLNVPGKASHISAVPNLVYSFGNVIRVEQEILSAKSSFGGISSDKIKEWKNQKIKHSSVWKKVRRTIRNMMMAKR